MNVVLRIDSDLPMNEGVVLDNSRIKKSLNTIKLLLGKENKLIILGHLGRPNGRDKECSLKPVYLELMSLLEPDGEDLVKSVFVEKIDKNLIDEKLQSNQLVFVENVRFWEEEEKGEFKFLEPIIQLAQAYVNDAFAVAHRKNASTMLFKKIKGYYGLSFVEETEKILRVIQNPERPLTVVLGGAKKDKLGYLPNLEKIADNILVGGKLPDYISKEFESEKVVVGEFDESGLDISQSTIDRFKEYIYSSKTIIWAGAMGFYESENERRGTEAIARAIAESGAYSIVAGGDTTASIASLGLKERVNFVASGGGVMLELLTKGTLPTWE